MKHILNRHFCYPKVEKVALCRRRELIDKMTLPERIVLKYLKELDYRIEVQKIVFYSRGKFYIPDFYLPDYKVVIEVDGYHHNLKNQRMRDDLRTSRLLKSGVNKVIRFPNSVCKKGDYFKSLLRRELINYIERHYG